MDSFNLASDVIREAKKETKKWKVACMVSLIGWIGAIAKLLLQ